jgi:hypothetical protein
VRVTPNCDSLNSYFISQANYVQLEPDVAFGGGNYMVVWTDSRSRPYDYRIYGARVAPSGAVLDPNGIPIGTDYMLSQWSPSVVFTGSRFFTVWGYGDSPFRLLGRFIEPDGRLSDTCWLAAADTSVYMTRLAHDGTNFLMVWEEGRFSVPVIRGQLVSGVGAPIGGPFTVATGVRPAALGLCFDGTNYCITYSTNAVWGRKYDRSGQPVGSAFRISSSPYIQTHSDIIPGPNNRYFNVWAEYRSSSSYDIYGNVDIPIVGIEEAGEFRKSRIHLASCLVKNVIQITGAEGRLVSLFDISGCKIGTTRSARFDCRHLACGIYFVKTESGERFRVVKIR